MKFGIIYKVTSPSGNVYIGQITYKLDRRKSFHKSSAFNKKSHIYNTKFCAAIRKYSDRLTWEVIHDRVPVGLLDDFEIDEISKHNSYKSGYNSTPGGSGAGRVVSDLSRKKMSLSKKGKYTGKDNPMYGKSHSKKVREVISKRHKGKFAGSKNPRAKINEYLAKEIRRKYLSGNHSYSDLATEYGVGKSTICRVINKNIWNMTRVVVDIDGTLCEDIDHDKYDNAKPHVEMIRLINELYDQNYYIIIFTARGMGNGNESISRAYTKWYTRTENQLERWGIKYHELQLGKPAADLYVDDKGFRVSRDGSSADDLRKFLDEYNQGE